VLKKLVTLLVIGGLSLLPAAGFGSDIIPTNEWTDFYGSATLYNGNPIPVGSIIDAYDSSGVHCGTFTVHTPGQYGFMAVYGDDSHSEGVDEGAEQGEPITFYVNGRMAVPQGPDEATWVGSDFRPEVNLSASATLGIESVSMPDDATAYPGQAVRYYATVRNTGNGIDFYTVSGTTSNGWVVKPMPGFVYALPGQEATIYFDVLVPTAIFYSMTDMASFRISSGIDAGLYIEGTVTTFVDMPTDVDDDSESLIPGNFLLHQNYPNPFNPSTKISFELSSKAAVELDVFDILGRRVSHVDFGMLGIGTHNYDFDGSDLSSGVYFYRLKAGGSTQVKKMALMK